MADEQPGSAEPTTGGPELDPAQTTTETTSASASASATTKPAETVEVDPLVADSTLGTELPDIEVHFSPPTQYIWFIAL